MQVDVKARDFWLALILLTVHPRHLQLLLHEEFELNVNFLDQSDGFLVVSVSHLLLIWCGTYELVVELE